MKKIYQNILLLVITVGLMNFTACIPAGYYTQAPHNNNPNTWQQQQAPLGTQVGTRQQTHLASTGNPTNPRPTAETEDQYYLRLQGRNRDRNQDLPRARIDDSCESESSSHKCRVQCQDMYFRTGDQEDCRELDSDDVQRIYLVWEKLKSTRHLEYIDAEHFDWFLNVSIAGFDHLIRDYRHTHAEKVLVWISENPDIADVMRDEDRDFKRLEDLFHAMIQRFKPYEEAKKPFVRRMHGSSTLFSYALETGNNTAVNYFLDYILQTDTNCRNKSSPDEDVDDLAENCLKTICQVGHAVSYERDREGFLESYIFQEFIEDVITRGINSATTIEIENVMVVNPDHTRPGSWEHGSGENEIDDIDDLDYTWANEDYDKLSNSKSLCEGLTQ